MGHTIKFNRAMTILKCSRFEKHFFKVIFISSCFILYVQPRPPNGNRRIYAKAFEYLPLLFVNVHRAILKQSLFYCYGIDMKYYYNSRREIILESHGGHLQT